MPFSGEESDEDPRDDGIRGIVEEEALLKQDKNKTAQKVASKEARGLEIRNRAIGAGPALVPVAVPSPSAPAVSVDHAPILTMPSPTTPRRSQPSTATTSPDMALYLTSMAEARKIEVELKQQAAQKEMDMQDRKMLVEEQLAKTARANALMQAFTQPGLTDEQRKKLEKLLE